MTRRYSKNGTPIGDYKVYAITIKDGARVQVFEVKPQGVETYEELEQVAMSQAMSGPFGRRYDRLVLTMPGANLEGVNLEGANLNGANLREADLRKANIIRAKLQGVNLEGANLNGAILVGAKLQGVNLEGADLRSANLKGAIIQSANLVNANIERAYLERADLNDADLYGVNLIGATLQSANLVNAILVNANLTRANLTRANLGRADLSQTSLQGANLEGANLEGANLEGANLREADLREANLREAYLREAYLIGANLSYANLTRADLQNANLTRANLSYAKIHYADLQNANLEGANLRGTGLEGTTLDRTPYPHSTYGRMSGDIIKAQKSIGMSSSEFKKKHPSEAERLKSIVRGRPITRDVVAEVRSSVATLGSSKEPLVWLVSRSEYHGTQRITSHPNKVALFNIYIQEVPIVHQDFLLRLAATARKSGHPQEDGNLFTVGWVRYLNLHDAILIEEVQSDVDAARRGIMDKRFLEKMGYDEGHVRKLEGHLDFFKPYAEAFYYDAIGTMFEIADAEGKSVEMITFDQKRSLTGPGIPPRSVYEDIPRKMGMKKIAESSSGEVSGPIWHYKPNRRRR